MIEYFARLVICMIKNLEIFTNSKAKRRLLSLSLIGVITSSCLVGCSSQTNEDINQIIEETQEIQEQEDKTILQKKIFEPGEHILTVRSGYSSNSIKQHTYYDGYDVIGITGYDHSNYGTCIYVLYVNNVAVECVGVKNKYGNYEYNQFGVPIVLEKELVKTK